MYAMLQSIPMNNEYFSKNSIQGCPTCKQPEDSWAALVVATPVGAMDLVGPHTAALQTPWRREREGQTEEPGDPGCFCSQSNGVSSS